MKKFFLSFLIFFSVASSKAQTFIQAMNDTIPDAGPVVSFPISISVLPASINSAFGIEKISFTMTHTYTQDIAAWLQSPDGTTVLLLQGVGGSGDNFTNTELKWDASTSIVNGTAPFSGSFRPMGLLGNFNNGQNPNGVWNFMFQDQAAVDIGVLLSLSITFSNDAALGVVFDSTRLPIVKINTGGVSIPDGNKIPASFTITDNGWGNWNMVSQTNYAYSGNMMVELQGFTGVYYPKKNYDFDLTDSIGEDIDTSLLGLPSENDWILKAEYLDYSLMKNSLTYEMCRRMGRYAPRTKFCEVFLNNDYIGVYTLTEKVKRDTNRVNISKLNKWDTTGAELTGGYIIEMNINGDPGAWNSTYLPINSATCTLPVEFKHVYPKADSIHILQHYYIKSYTDSFENALWNSNFQDPINGWRKFAGEGSFIDFLIVNEFSANYDSYGRSTYLYKEKITDGGKLHIGPPWDYDRAYENGTQGGWVHEITHPTWPYPFWWSKFRQDSVYMRNLYCRWHSLRETTLSNDSFLTFIDTTSSYIHDAAVRNFLRWSELGITDYDAQVLQLKDYVTQRNSWIDAALPDTEYVNTSANLPDVTICNGDVVNATVGGSWMFGYIWSTGATTQSIPITSSGNYSVTVSSIYGCPSSSDNFDATVLPIPDASFSWTSLGGNAYLFTPATTNAPLYLWDFGNGNISSSVSPTAVLVDTPSIVTLTVYGLNGCSSVYSDTLNQFTNTNDFLMPQNLSVYPNPALNELNISTKGVSVSIIEIIDLAGRQIEKIETTCKNSNCNFKIDISLIASGVYYLRAKTQNGNWETRRFVKSE